MSKRRHFIKMFRSFAILLLILNKMNGDCIYPQWKTTCQKYCMDNKFYEIQLNQCYSMDVKQLTCKCSGQILTYQILKMIENKTMKSSSILMSSSTISSNLSSETTSTDEHISSLTCSIYIQNYLQILVLFVLKKSFT